eukprot:COSAG02_NODE_42_length_46522_cov_109.704478_1_plen_471_part_00
MCDEGSEAAGFNAGWDGMASEMAAEHPPESVPPQKRASGAEIAPLVDAADAAILRRAERAVAEAKAEAEAREAREASEAEAREAREAWRRECAQKAKSAAQLLSVGVAITIVVLPIAYLSVGCGACENDAECDGLLGDCVCRGNHLGEHCQHSCGEFGEVSGSACICSGDRSGAFCDLGMILSSDFNDVTVGAVMYRGATQDLTWQLQHELCNDAGRATPGSAAHASGVIQGCFFSSIDDHVVAGECNGHANVTNGTRGGWSDQTFTYVSGTLGGGVGYMCAGGGCNARVRVEGTTAHGEVGNEEPATLRDGDAVFCSTCQATDDSCCGISCGAYGQCSGGVCSCKEGADFGWGVWLGPSVCGSGEVFCEEIDEEARPAPLGTVIIELVLFLFLLVFVGLGVVVGGGLFAIFALCVEESFDCLCQKCGISKPSCDVFGRLEVPLMVCMAAMVLCIMVACVVVSIRVIGCD